MMAIIVDGGMVIEMSPNNQEERISSFEMNLLGQCQAPQMNRWMGPAEEMVHLRLYVAGCMINSKQAIANINAICEEHLAGHYSLEIIDALEEPLFALRDDVIVAPTLVKLSPGPISRLTGNLGQKDKVLDALGISVIRKGVALAGMGQN
jgi:circadian clock protein KaiB